MYTRIQLMLASFKLKNLKTDKEKKEVDRLDWNIGRCDTCAWTVKWSEITL